MSNLTIIIPFLNEGIELENTLKSIVATTTGSPDIIIINDNSSDGYDYTPLSEKYNCKYILHDERKGVAASRDEGVNLTETKYFLLLDAHMEFYDNGWDEKICKILDENPKSLICSQTKVLCNDRTISNTRLPNTYGTVFKKDSVTSEWNYKDSNPDENICEVECIMGGAYACSKEYWILLHGLNGLLRYGLDEELITLKIKRTGGKTLLVKDWIVGHIYRKQFPYNVVNNDLIYNQLLIIELFFEGEEKERLKNHIKNTYNISYNNAKNAIHNNRDWIKQEKLYLNSLMNFN